MNISQPWCCVWTTWMLWICWTQAYKSDIYKFATKYPLRSSVAEVHNVFLFIKNNRQKGFLWEFIAQKISDKYMAEPRALDVILVPNQFLRCMRFETYEQAWLKIRSTPFEQGAFPHSFLVRAKRDKLLSFAFRISKGIQKVNLTWFSKYR